jgi:catechol 2,3-dioxygenase-like lactoylglutathione lyase family enzyme
VPHVLPEKEDLMTSRIAVITIDCADPQRLVTFWSEALGYEIREDTVGCSLCDPTGVGLGIGFQPVPEGKIVKNRVHLDLTPSEGDLDAEVARLEQLGARRVHYFDHDPQQVWWVMQDPEENEFCVVQFLVTPHK